MPTHIFFPRRFQVFDFTSDTQWYGYEPFDFFNQLSEQIPQGNLKS